MPFLPRIDYSYQLTVLEPQANIAMGYLMGSYDVRHCGFVFEKPGAGA
jgi:hypothetical protein